MIIPLLVLALMQGLLEFLPVSSEGQILLVAVNIYHFDAAFTLSLIFWLHLGTAFTIIVFYHRDIFGSLCARISPPVEKEKTVETKTQKLFGPLFVFVVVGTLGTVVVALPLYFFLQGFVTYFLGNVITAFIGILLIVTGVVLYFQRGVQGDLVLIDISLKEAFVLGLLQGIAVLPGISRSGMTLTWLLVRGVKREEALRLSFILAVPATFGVVALDLIFGETLFVLPWIFFVMIGLVAFLTGLGALAVLRYSAVRVPWWIFCIVLGAIVLVLTIPTIIFGVP
ncbi:MAG: undecaprenyl-diphosphate phosphatase [Promethearchaeota archaeon]